ncbi:cold shock domain-containing protein [Cyanobacterium stanieri LEGE 03274]|uniref:Cold shock domain-containing protein n=1 Tax=Cyanobacterium stanieri LEGE 03274 TaxID=1828756 RepID=A0ABR9V0F0_9CHRO|nr:cold shock domain-containing protein [Cyanobacterium stanieri]MBE9221317.1 cold shock domain-containing protein [Cyanobacterium stanieri LEGE 03274]
MTIDFGYIKNYHSDRGFGFVGCTFSNQNSQVFFHIKKIKSKYRELAQKLDNDDIFEPVSFWYEIETTQKRKQVSEVWLNKDDIPSCYAHQFDGFIETVENMWKNIDSSKPSWLDIVTIELVGINRKDELSLQRNNLEIQRREAEERKRKDADVERLRQIELQRERERQEVEHQKQIRVDKENEVRRLSVKYEKYLEGVEAAGELYELLEEMRQLPEEERFTHSKQLSNYIVRKKLGYKYKHISGILRMQNGTDEWDFKGGFPTDIYRIICQELGLDNQHTTARPVGFRSFKDVYKF